MARKNGGKSSLVTGKNGGKLTAMAIVKDRHTKIEENTSGNEV